MKSFVLSSVLIVLLLCSCHKNKTESIQPVNTEVQDTQKTKSVQEVTDKTEGNVSDSTNVSETKITKEMAYEGVNNYCHQEYDWNVAKDNPSIMYVTMGDETESEFNVIFRSYTGSFVYFYVNKANGTTRMVEHVPALDIESEAGTINLFDYLEKKK